MSNMWYGSVYNRMQERGKQPEPKVGMYATEMYYTDREPFEIIEVKDERHITARKLSYKRVDKNGMSECQDYIYFPNPDGRIAHLFKTKQGRWVERIGKHYSCNGWALGFAERYYDYSF